MLISGVFVANSLKTSQKKETLKNPIDNGIYTIYPNCYKEGNDTYVTFSVKNKEGIIVIPEENKWLLRDFFEIDFDPLYPESEPGIIVISRDTETLFGKCAVVFRIKGQSTDDSVTKKQ